MEIQVTLADMETGIPKLGDLCAIAVSVCRKLGRTARELNIEVDGSELSFEVNGYTSRYRLPKEAQRFIELYDARSDDAVPFNFTATEKDY